MSTYKDNYFERQKARGGRSGYRFYLWDYLYYCGEKHWKKWGRFEGGSVIFFYWLFCVMTPLYASPTRLAAFLNSNLIISLSIGIAFPIVFGLLRYRKKRTTAIMKHFSRSSWLKGMPVWMVSMGWLPIWLLEIVIIKVLGWG